MAAGRRREGRAFVDAIDDDQVVAAIGRAEAATTGQIRVHVSGRTGPDVEQAARRQFTRLGMAGTPDRNAVLIHLQPRTHTFCVLGDEGANARIGDDGWRRVADLLAAELTQGRPTEGLVAAVAQVGELLAVAFPRDPGRPPDEGLPDEVTGD